MNIDFGIVTKYQRGFGFVSHTFLDPGFLDAAFHLSVVHKSQPIIAKLLSTKKEINVCFWYEYKIEARGCNVILVLEDAIAQKINPKHLASLIDKTMKLWPIAWGSFSELVKKATYGFLEPDEASQLSILLKLLGAEKLKRKEELEEAEKLRIEEADLLRWQKQYKSERAVEAAKHKEYTDRMAAQKKIEDDEFKQLLNEISAMHFTRSSEVSEYIVRNKLGSKYKHISGILEMDLHGRRWNFNGGFSPEVYARLCEALGLGNQGSQSTPVSFTPYKDLFQK
ncbi:MAG TPA: hypothetical protein PKE33_07325 [Kiritimatiellia bacterium]|nr:hypothetical protein [Kiritimatiellia bacterium]